MYQKIGCNGETVRGSMKFDASVSKKTTRQYRGKSSAQYFWYWMVDPVTTDPKGKASSYSGLGQHADSRLSFKKKTISRLCELGSGYSRIRSELRSDDEKKI